jgi:hypothetical protein
MVQTNKPEMSDPPLDSGISAGEVRAELAKILSSRTFHTARGQSKFLAYAVTQFVAGRSDLIKESWIGREALGRGDSFDPRLDPIVRTQARKLRIRLAKYYETEGADAPIRIAFYKGSYAPVFERAQKKSEPAAPAQSTSFTGSVDVPHERVALAQPPVSLPPPRAPEQPSWFVRNFLMRNLMRNPAVLAISLWLLIFAAALATYAWLAD